MNQYFDNIKRLVSKGAQSDSYAQMFASHLVPGEILNNKQVRGKVDLKVIWKNNPIYCLALNLIAHYVRKKD